jgi:hypothetical protein
VSSTPRDILDDDPQLSVAHAIPGRIRLRIPPGARTSGLAQAVSQLDGVSTAEWTPRTRSLLVRYRAATISVGEIVEIVARHGNVALPPDVASAPSATDGRSPVATAMVELATDLNRRLAERTHGTLDLRTLVPLGLAVWAVRELLRGQLAPLGWSSALWYAHGLFRDYNLPSAEQ